MGVWGMEVRRVRGESRGLAASKPGEQCVKELKELLGGGWANEQTEDLCAEGR